MKETKKTKPASSFAVLLITVFIGALVFATLGYYISVSRAVVQQDYSSR